MFLLLLVAVVAMLIAVAVGSRIVDPLTSTVVHEGVCVLYLDDCWLFEGGVTVTCHDGWQWADAGYDLPPMAGARYRITERRTVLGSPMIVEEVR